MSKTESPSNPTSALAAPAPIGKLHSTTMARANPSPVLANGPAIAGSANQSGEGDIRRDLIEADLVDTALRDSAFPQSEATPQVVSTAKDNMVALPGQLFYSTQIPDCLGFFAKNKNAAAKCGMSGRRHQTNVSLPKA